MFDDEEKMLLNQRIRIERKVNEFENQITVIDRVN